MFLYPVCRTFSLRQIPPFLLKKINNSKDLKKTNRYYNYVLLKIEREDMSNFEINIDFLTKFKGKSDCINSADFKNLQKLFNIFDKNKDGTLDNTEIKNIFDKLSQVSDKNTGDNREIGYSILDESEAEAFLNQSKDDKGKSLKELGISIKDFFDFLKTMQTNAPEEEFSSDDEQEGIMGKVSASLDDNEDNVELTPQEQAIAEKFENIPQRGKEQFSSQDCQKLAKLSKEELEIAQQLLYIEGRQNQFSADDIIFIAKCGDGKFEIPKENMARMSEFFTLDNRGGLDINPQGLLEILSHSNEDIDKAKLLLSSPARTSSPLTEEEVCYILDCGSKTLYDTMISNPKAHLTRSVNRNIFEMKLDDKNYRYIIGQELPEEITETTTENGRIVQIDNKNLNVHQTITYSSVENYAKEVASRIETIHLDSNGDTEYTEIVENSDIPGVQNIYQIDKNGNRTDIQSGSIDTNTGLQTVKKHLDNGQGKITDVTLISNNDNEYNLSYQITDNTKNPPQVIYEKEQSLEKTGDNSYLYTLNGKTYSIKQTREKLQITDNSNNSTHELDLSKLIQDKDDEIFLSRISKLPAELLIYMAKHPLDSLDYGNFEVNNGHYNPDNNLVEIGNIEFEGGTGDAAPDVLYSILLHELGHYIDGADEARISGNKELTECYKRELSNYTKTHTSEESRLVEYFTGAAKTERRGRSETIAEMCMLLNGNPKEITEIRAQYLQQFFPETMAIVARLREQVLQN